MRTASLMLVPALAVAAGCAMEVSQPGKTRQEAQAAIQACSDEAKRVYWYDAVTALEYAYDCIERRGYRLGSSSLAGFDAPARAVPEEAPVPCRVPCR